MSVFARRDATNVPLELTVNQQPTGGLAGLTATVALRRADTSDAYLDWSDMTFKTSAWVLKFKPLTDIGGGAYVLVSGLSIAAITNLPAGTSKLEAKYLASDASNTIETHEMIELDGFQQAQEANDASIIATISELLAINKNRLEMDFGTQELVLWNAAGTTVIQRWPLASNGGEPVATQFAVQTKRGVPTL